MADAKGRKDGERAAGTEEGRRTSLAIRLTPVDNSDMPVVANYTAINVAPGLAYIDFGFLEPALLAALPQVAKQGGNLPESVNGRLAVRVAIGYEALQNLKLQIDRLVAAAGRAQQGPAK